MFNGWRDVLRIMGSERLMGIRVIDVVTESQWKTQGNMGSAIRSVGR